MFWPMSHRTAKMGHFRVSSCRFTTAPNPGKTLVEIYQQLDSTAIAPYFPKLDTTRRNFPQPALRIRQCYFSRALASRKPQYAMHRMREVFRYAGSSPRLASNDISCHTWHPIAHVYTREIIVSRQINFIMRSPSTFNHKPYH